MKVSLNWIKDYVPLPEDMDLKSLAYDLTMSTVEVEGVTDLAASFDGLIVGEIKEVLPHPNADKLRICRTDIGGGEIREIVCGGSNLAPGMKVVVAKPGAFVRWHGEGEPVEIKEAKLRGVLSYGMICASSETGLSDLFPEKEEAEITDLSAFDVSPGTPVADALDLHDILLEIDNKSMTNRPDLWGHYGIAREIAALYELPLKEIRPFDAGDIKSFPVQIEDPERCPRYIGAELDGVAVKPSPFWMQSRLWRVGQRPINALVDITNYVMMAVGQPTHAFDADNIKGGITVRRAGAGEKLLLLNDKSLELSGDDLVIADDKEAVALAGVMGGALDSILDKTTRVILEVANFEASGVRRTALRYDNRTEASSRYEKAVDIERCDPALSLAMDLFRELYPEMKVTAFTDLQKKKSEVKTVDVELDWLARRLGMRLPEEKIKKKLSLLGFTVSIENDLLSVKVPSWRATGDISMKADIMEEVARMYGYENFEPTPITTSFTGAVNQRETDLLRRIKEYLAFRCNMQEVFTYPWMNDREVEALFPDQKDVLFLSTPPAPNESRIRFSLLPNLCRAIGENERYFDEFSIFEEAEVFFDRDYNHPNDETEALPYQPRHIAGAVVGSSEQVVLLFRRMKGILAEMAKYTHMEELCFEKREAPSWADPNAHLTILTGGREVGHMGVLKKKASLGCGIKEAAAVLFELNFDELIPLKSRTNTFTHLTEVPWTEYDVSMLFDRDTKWETIRETALKKKNAESFLQEVDFVDEYTGAQIPAGKKSVTMRLTIGANEKTLTSEQIEGCAKTVMKFLTKQIGAEARF
ncbi:MAG: phenylalanine--tRNA ligase subunit beta [Lachnospiraceae bacterium]|nr:phenylalanine--tRNA ligase subunit beta [Lachnospiraceae bacterium]